MKFTYWTIVKNYDAVNGGGTVSENSFEAVLNNGRYSLTKAVSLLEGMGGEGLYEFSYDLYTDPNVTCQAVYSWMDKDGTPIFRAHAIPGEKVICPKDACKVELNVCFYGFNGGVGRISNAEVNYVGEYKPHNVTLAAIMVAHEGIPTIESNIKVCAERIDAAAAAGADLILLPETYNTRAVAGLKSGEGAAAMDEPAITMLRDKAIQHGIYTAASVRLKDEQGLVSNTVVMFDRKGNFVGQYTKCHLTVGEIWSGLIPGQEVNTFDTELGRIGCSICWDRFFPEHHRLLFLQNADIVLNPTASGKYPLEEVHNGYSNCAYIVTAQTTEDASLTRITNRRGEVIATADPETGFAIATVDMNAYEPVYWLSVPDADTDPRSVYRYERRADLYGPLAEPGIRR